MSHPEILPITETDDELRALLDDPGVELPAILPALAHALGDLTLLRDSLRLDLTNPFAEQGGWTPEQQEECRDLAAEALARLRDHDGPLAPAPSGADLHAMMNWTTGTTLDEAYLAMLTEELAPEGADLRAPTWHKDDIAPDTPMRVVIVGAGMSGILAAHRLAQAGIDYVVLEKNPGIGGTWFENTYPGCRVDVPNHTYCYSFMQKHDWPGYHSSQGVLLEYFNDCADQFGIRDHIRFDTEVQAVVFDDERATWTLELSTPDGEATLEANAVISAVGQLNRPQLPDIEGRESFEGPAFHSARWDHDVDLAGRRVAVIGNGCSAMQFIPHVAEVADHVTVCQRTANWMVPRPQYAQPLNPNLMWLFTHVPHFSNWYRLHLFWRSHEGLLPALAVDPDWPEPIETSVSAANDELRELLTLNFQAEFADRPDLLEKTLPRNTAGAKRFVIDDGVWARTLKRDNVELCTTGIERITPEGLVDVDGSSHDVDVIVYGTGFKASEFLTPMKVVGRGGVDLHEQWDGNARAYLGVVSPNFPNFFFMYGPNTNIVINGSIIYFSECEAHYITESLRRLLETGHRALDVKVEVHDAYNERIDAGNLGYAWGVSSVNSWYKSKSGRVAQNWPFSMLEFWEQTRQVDPDDYHWL